jgi:hypothetical protein
MTAPATCRRCGRGMLAVQGCNPGLLESFAGDTFRPLPFQPPSDQLGRCRDCGAEAGGLHHESCCVEACPACGGQLLSCDCGLRRRR